LRFFEKLDDLGQFLLGFFHAGHVVKRHRRLFAGEHSGPALAKGHGLVSTVLCLPKDDQEKDADQDQGQYPAQNPDPIE
jgi:hypothetical protein